MSIKQTQRATRSIIRTLDNKIWDQLAYRAISKMPKFKLIKQSNKILHDFVLINTNDTHQFQQNLEHQQEKPNLKQDNRLVGGIKSIKQYKKYSKTQFSDHHNYDHPDDNNYHISFSLPINKAQPQSADKKCTKLFISQSNQQEENQQNFMRKTRMENIRYNKKLDELKTQTQFYNNARTLSEKKKLKESKLFTFDYQGKLLSTKVKNSTNIKFVNIKSKLNQNVNRERRHLLEKLRSTQYSDVVEKKVISYQGAQVEHIREDRAAAKPVTPNYNNSLNQLFKDNKSIQLGVSITDIQNNSKLMGINKQQLSHNCLKLNEFKRSFKSASMINKNSTQKQPSQKAASSKASPSPALKNTLRINTISDVQSKMIESSISRYSKRADRININQKIFLQSFYNDHL